MRYEVQRQDENGNWHPMAAHDDRKIALTLLTDKYRRVRDTHLGINIVFTPAVPKPPVWDLIGMVLTADWRLLLVVPALAVFCYWLSAYPLSLFF